MPDKSQIATAAASLERRVAATIADMRGRRGLSHGDLAALLGVPAERIARLESGEAGQAASLATLAEIAECLDFHVTLGLHDRQRPALGATDAEPALKETLGDLASAVTLGETLDLGSAADIFPADDGVITIPDEPGQSFLLDDSVTGIASPKQKDDTFSPGGGGDGFGDGMSS